MPCTDGGPSIFDVRQVNDLQAKVDKLTDMLCRVMVHVEDANLLDSIAPMDVHEWWRAHKQVDVRRLERELAVAATMFNETKVRLEREEEELKRIRKELERKKK